MSAAAPETTLHASTVQIDGKAVVITGPSGSGKSGLALQLLSLGAGLIADDMTRLTQRDGVLIAHPPARLAGVIEARGVGLLNTTAAGAAPVVLVVDMGRTQAKRLPEHESLTVSGIAVPLICRVDAPHFPSAIWHLAKYGRYA